MTTDVPTPKDFGLSYEDLSLHTSDGITLRCYLLPQTRDLHHPDAARVEGKGLETDDEVMFQLDIM
jgi:hypothetical protein